MFLNENMDIFNESVSGSEAVLEGVAPLLECALESEMSWNNIMQEQMTAEFAILQEAGDNVEEVENKMKKTDDSTIQKIKRWIKEHIQMIGEAFKKICRKIVDSINKVVAYKMSKDQNDPEKAKKIASGVEVTVNIHDWVRGSSTISALTNLSATHMKKTCDKCTNWGTGSVSDSYKNDIDDVVTSFKNFIDKDILPDGNPKDITLNKSDCAKYLSAIKSLKSDMNKLTSLNYKGQISHLKIFYKDLSREMNVKSIHCYKYANSALGKIDSTSISLATKFMSDCVRVLKKAYA